TEYYLFKHVGIMILALGLMYLAHLIKYTYYARISQIALYIAIPLLAYTLFFGTSYNEASRWYTLPVINISFQPSDFAKLALIIFIARLLTKKQNEIKEFKSAFVPIILPILLVCGLILPADFSTAGLLFLTSLVLIFIGRVNLKYIFGLIGISIVMMGLLIMLIYQYPDVGRFGTWKNRVEQFTGNSDEGNYQAEQAKIAIATGGIFGKMPGNSMQKDFLPHPYSDYIYAIIIEEFGLIGGFLILFMYLILLHRSIKIVIRSPRHFGAFLAIGLSLSLVFQAFIHMSVSLGLLPVTGLTLPLVSMGGTSLWFTSIAIGIILSVSRDIETHHKTTTNIATA
ncbi:MAG: FtsW/RodA/SpoVE family cell cycle protein, partial [Bacteroidales bacterium]|nr:FtsW/RodA/SpoVE family cell cycle protein [Bacteroidales bacterium]